MQGKSQEERLREYRTYIAKERLRKIDHVFVQNLEKQNLSEGEQIIKIRSYLAKNSFEYYKNEILAQLHEVSISTGREIKKTDAGNGGVDYHLDTGKFEKNEALMKDIFQFVYIHMVLRNLLYPFVMIV